MALLLWGHWVLADSVTIAGNLTSDASAVSSTDPVITAPSTIHSGDSFSLLLTYDPASFTQSASSYVLTDASVELEFDGYSFDFSSVAGNYIQFSSPGVFGTGTVSFLICSSLPGCSSSDFMNLYFTGTIASPATLQAQAGGLSGDPGSSPAEFEFLRNFADGSQTDLQGTLLTPVGGAPVPEPTSLALVSSSAAGILALWSRRRRKPVHDPRRRSDGNPQ